MVSRILNGAVPCGIPALVFLAVACTSRAPLPGSAANSPTANTAGQAAPTVTRGGTLSIGLNTRIATLDPNKWTSSIESAMGYQIYDYLVLVDPGKSQVEPWLAESWTVSADGLVYTFKLRSGVKFQDGTDFDASAAKVNLDRVSPQSASAGRRDIASRLAKTNAPDPATLVVELLSPFPPFLSALGSLPMASPSALDHWGDDYGQHPVGTGPFKVTDWASEDHLTLERNPEYAWPPSSSSNQGAAFLDSVTFKLIPDPPARLLSLESGDTQMSMYVPLQDVARIATDRQFKIVQASTSGMPLTFFMNPSSGPLADRQVRVAIQSALNRSELINAGGYGIPSPGQGLLTSTIRCFNSSFATIFPYDVARARQILDDAGWQLGADGIRHKDDAPLVFDFVFFPDYANVAAVIQAQLQAVGVQLDPKMLDLPAASVLMRNGQASSFLVANIAVDPASALSGTFHSRWIGSNSESGAILHDPENDTLLEQAAQEPDSTKQCQLYDDFQRRYLDSAVAYPVWEVATPLAMRSSIEGVRLVPLVPNMPLLQEVYLDR